MTNVVSAAVLETSVETIKVLRVRKTAVPILCEEGGGIDSGGACSQKGEAHGAVLADGTGGEDFSDSGAASGESAVKGGSEGVCEGGSSIGKSSGTNGKEGDRANAAAGGKSSVKSTTPLCVKCGINHTASRLRSVCNSCRAETDKARPKCGCGLTIYGVSEKTGKPFERCKTCSEEVWNSAEKKKALADCSGKKCQNKVYSVDKKTGQPFAKCFDCTFTECDRCEKKTVKRGSKFPTCGECKFYK